MLSIDDRHTIPCTRSLRTFRHILQIDRKGKIRYWSGIGAQEIRSSPRGRGDARASFVATGKTYLFSVAIPVFAVTSISIIRPGKKSLFTSTVVDAGKGPFP